MTNIKMQPKFTPRKSVVLFCRACNGDCSGLCNSKTCVLYPYQKSRNLPNSKMFSIKFIKMYCLSSCTARTSKGVKECSDTECPLHPFRLGKNPFVSGGKGRTVEQMKWARQLKNSLEISSGFGKIGP